tara:strand:+ start:757 stop:1041 length:285 start_codon:yes stop_codon:yes gene_type:complete
MNEVNITLKARDGKILNTTESGNVRANATRRNPNADREGAPATLPMDQTVDYSYFNVKNGSFTVKFVNDVYDYTFYVADKAPVQATEQAQVQAS